MTNRIAIFLLILMIGSCSTDIRNMAIKYNSQGAVHNVAEAFAEAYYRMPVSLDEIKNFCSDFREAYLSEGTMIGMFEEWMEGQMPEEYFSEKYVMLESYQDSCFIYDRKHKIGCCLYGSPCFLINTDEMKARSYSPSFFDKSGKYIFCDLDCGLSRRIKKLTQKYKHAIMRIRDPDSIQNSFREYVTATEATDTVAYHAVLRYSSSGIEPVCGSQLSKTQFLQYSKTEKKYYDIQESCDLAILCEAFLFDVRCCIDDFVSTHQNVETIIFHTVCVF